MAFIGVNRKSLYKHSLDGDIQENATKFRPNFALFSPPFCYVM